MGTIEHMVKVRWADDPYDIRPLDPKHCPNKNGLTNVCSDDNVKCPHMLDSPAAKQLSDRHFMMHCNYKNENN